MALQVAESVAMVDESAANTSSLLSLHLPGNHDQAHNIWLMWQVFYHPLFQQWFNTVWQMVLLKR